MVETPGRITVLHVDDDVEFLELSADLLAGATAPIEVETATSVAEARDLLADASIDYIVSDHDMPATDGIAFLEEVREREPELPFVLFTGKGSEEVAAEAITAGVTDYLQKESGTDQFAILANRIENLVSSARAREEARISRDRFETLSATFPDVAFFIDDEGRYLDVLTGSPETLLAAPPDDLVGSRFDEVLPPDEADSFLSTVERTLETGETQTVEYQLEVPAGERWFEARTAPLETMDRDAVLWVARDITPRKEHRERLQEYRQIVDTMQEHACIYDRDERIAVVNDSLVDFLGTTREDLEGTQSRLLPRIREEAPGDPFAALVAGDREVESGEIEVPFTDGGPTVLSYRLSRLAVDGEVRGVVAVSRVVTERREYERLLETQQERFEEFAGVLSHDLRNSLNIAESRLELASDECDSDHLAAIDDAHDRIEHDLDDLLTLARGAGYAMDVEPVSPEVVSRRAWSATATKAATLQLAIEEPIQADAESVERLLEQLFSNAIQHGGPDVTVTVGRLPEGFYVEDDGAGIGPALRDSLLGSALSGREEGCGFGLRIVAEIARSHGWEVTLAEGEAGGLRAVCSGVSFAG